MSRTPTDTHEDDDNTGVDLSAPAGPIGVVPAKPTEPERIFEDKPEPMPVDPPIPDTPAPEPEPVIPPVIKLSATVTLDKPVMEPLKAGDAKQYPIFTLRVSVDDFNAAVTKYPNFRMQGDAESRTWLDTVRNALPLMLIGSAHIGALSRDKSEWRQDVEYEGLHLAIGKPPVIATPGQKLTGERAIMKIQQAMGLGTMIQVPLWHSGLWITLKTPTDSALLNLERQIAEEKINLGRQTNGLIYSNAMVYIVNHLYNFIVEHIYDATMKDYSPDKLRSVLRVTDLPTLVWALACTIYPNGFTHSQPCTSQPDKCRHITKDHLNLSKLSWVDRTALSRSQQRYMANRAAKHTLDEILAYQREGVAGDGKVVPIKDGVSFVLRVPTVQQYVETGFRWVAEIVDMVEAAVSDTMSANDKNRFISQHSDLVALRQYVHWIKHIVCADDSVIEDVENMDELMNIMSTSDDIVDTFLKAIKDYIDEATIAMIALPSYKCPACGGDMSPAETKHPYLIPLETTMLFFTLRDRRLLRVKTN